ncbi:hypothetical protein Bhyg_12911 [Pseudolycoriella hygida]|uniref:Uncharacterized protein n=1 Tax=Pseudolycoriella hygida TaxID=35572 RepID=A0A9Q0MYB2_9DIPT|nr:hypothetical protein Bhyg_12911 [Pseudolycoriella hygida]
MHSDIEKVEVEVVSFNCSKQRKLNANLLIVCIPIEMEKVKRVIRIFRMECIDLNRCYHRRINPYELSTFSYYLSYNCFS